jgi:SAM-dependent methyltransferase
MARGCRPQLVTGAGGLAVGLHPDAAVVPFVSASFDLVVSGLALSNIREAGSRPQALREAVRVLRPGGRPRIVDDGSDRYAAVLRDVGCTHVAVRQLDWRTWYGIPGHRFPLVAAARPPGLRPPAMASQGERGLAASRRSPWSPGPARRRGHHRYNQGI